MSVAVGALGLGTGIVVNIRCESRVDFVEGWCRGGDKAILTASLFPGLGVNVLGLWECLRLICNYLVAYGNGEGR